MSSKSDIYETLFCITNEFYEERKKARENFLDFVVYVKGDAYDLTWFHEKAIGILGDFCNAISSRVMFFAPPQHGKSELSSRLLPAFMLGRDPKKKMALLCYAGDIAKSFSKDVKDIILSQKYRELFPATIIDGCKGTKKGQFVNNAYEFGTSEKGYLISVGVGGKLTSKTVDIAVIDDLYKGPSDAWSAAYRKKVSDWYWSVLETRLHNESKVLILFTRWHELDVAGEILDEEPEAWRIIKYEIIRTSRFENPEDPRAVGEALWPARHSLEKAQRWRDRDETSFEALGQQNPNILKGKMYPKEFKVYNREMLDELEEYGAVIKSYTDTADTGADYLVTYIFYHYEKKAYIKDIIFTKDSMDITIDLWAATHAKNRVTEAKVEYNNGGHPFALYAEDKLINIYNFNGCSIDGFHQTENKAARILTQAAWVQENILFPENWHLLWPDLYSDLKHYMKEGQNEHDDAEDGVTGVAEMLNDDEFWVL